MPDLHLRMTGDSAGASGAMHDAGLSAEKLKENVKELALEFFAFEKAKEMVVDFVKESITAYADLEKSQRQLAAVAGEMTEEFVKQAEVFEKKYAVDLKTTEALQTLMLRFQAAPEQIKGTTQAVLDYAAATGHDAEGATQSLMRAVERGANGVKSLGIVYQSTGDKTLDLALATAELEKKYGGAADTERAGLSGSLRAVALAQEHVHEAFGSMLATLDTKLGILDKTATVFERIAHSLNTMDVTKFSSFVTGFTSGGVIGGVAALAMTGGVSDDPTADEALSAQGGGRTGGNFGKLKTNGVGSFTDTLAKGKAAKDYGASDLRDAFGQFGGADAELKASEQIKNAYLQEEIDQARHFDKLKEQEKAQELFEEEQHTADLKRQYGDALDTKKLWDENLEEQIKDNARMQKLANEAMSKATADARKEAEHERDMWASIGQQTGQLFINAIEKELSSAIGGGSSGGGSSFRRVLGDLVQGALGIVFGAVLGEFGSKGISMSHIGDTIAGNEDPQTLKDNWGSDAPTSHDGAWIERFHGGGWPGRRGADEVPAVLQTGERVLSRAEVARMGGSAGVERAAGGSGGGMPGITVQAFDTQGVRDFFGDRGGRGMVNALRVGRGDIVPLLGRG